MWWAGVAVGEILSPPAVFKAKDRDGSMVAPDAEGDWDGVVARVPKADGSVIKPRGSNGGHRFIALI
jgi:hypothetical protein